MRNALYFSISINILVKAVLEFSALERLFSDYSRSTLFNPIFTISKNFINPFMLQNIFNI